MKGDEIFMRRCIELARLGQQHVAPNPMVGAVIVFKGKIIGEGYHHHFGAPHAEVNAIQAVENKSLLSKSTIYVSLEPCAHHGKTPPCADLIVSHKFKRVVIGSKDSFSKVSGRGIEKIKRAGIEVELGVLENECRELNKRFFTFHERQRPYVILKWAQSKDGFLDKIRTSSDPEINWITHPDTKALVHKWRSEEQSILVGRKTVQNDDPELTVREFSGNNPTRIIIDGQLQLSRNFNIFSKDAPTLVFNRVRSEKIDNIELIKIPETSTQHILEELHKRNIQSVFVEGGSRTIQYFIYDNVWDEARIIVGNKSFKEGTKAPAINKVPTHTYTFAEDTIYHYYRRK